MDDFVDKLARLSAPQLCMLACFVSPSNTQQGSGKHFNKPLGKGVDIYL